MPDPLAPIHRLTFADLSPSGLGGSAGGGWGGGVNGIAMNPAGPTVYVHVQQAFMDPLAVAVACWAWWLTPMGVIVIAYIISRTRAVLSRPQRPGVPHCRGCNYDLSGFPGGALFPGAPSEDERRREGTLAPRQCPECGRSLTARSIARGRSAAGRLAPLAVPAAVVLVGAVVAVLLSLGWRPILPAWPSPTAHRLADRLGVVVPNTFLVNCSTIAEADLSTGATLRTVARLTPAIRFFDVTPTGNAIVMGGGAFPRLIAVSARNGRELQRLDVPPPARAGGLTRAARSLFPLCGFTPDGGAVYLMLPDYGPPAATSIVKWSLADGSTTTVASLATYRDAQLLDRPRRALVLPGATPRVLSWAGLAELRETRRQTYELRTASGPPQIAADLGLGYEDVRASGVTADGSRLVLLRGRAIDSLERAREYELVTVSLDDLRPLETLEVPLRSVTAYAANDPRVRFIAAANDTGVALCDTAAPSRPWRSLGMPGGISGVSSLAFSSDGRFLVGVVAPENYPAWRFELLVWDIDSLRGTPAPPADGP